ncbi:prolyl oligopeptidase family serine peptidase [Ornithinibacillus sp. 4-3]|uniref:Prolyl oligopeptidase family serine peptidase n=1 Tax=Ornithinibacillus sp. 4-3 TaxID=3231488 RepID=A0AB39HSK0_9BACI
MEKQHVKQDDFYKFRLPSNPVISPNRKNVLYEVTTINENKYETHLWLADLDQQAKEQISVNESTENYGAVWSPDGTKIAFLTKQEAVGTQICIYDLKQRQFEIISHFKYAAHTLAFSTDGSKLYALLPILNTIEEADGKVDRIVKLAYESLYYKFDGTGFHDGTKQQIISINIKNHTYQQLTNTSLNIEAYTVSPTSEKLAFIAVDTENNNRLAHGVLYELSLANKEVTKLYDEEVVSKISYAPDGRSLAFIAGSLHNRLYKMDFTHSHIVCLDADYPDILADTIYSDTLYRRPPWQIVWSNDSKHIYALSGHHGTTEIIRFSANQQDKTAVVIGGARTISGFSYDGTDTFVLIYSNPETPGKLSKVSLDETAILYRNARHVTDDFPAIETCFPDTEICIDNPNQAYLEQVKLASFEAFTYAASDGWKMHGFLLKPANFEAGKKYPVVLDIHGGPHSTHGFTYFHQMQLFAAQGYAVIYVNPRGSSGYGEAFTKAVLNDYGGKDKVDILTGLEAAINQYNFLDESRMAISGLSYGGYMTNWIITQTDQFNVAIAEGSVSNLVSNYGTGDVDPGLTDEDMPDKNSFEALWEISPLAYVHKVNTPLLLIHAEDDQRVPIEQGEQFYSHIKRQGKTARFVRIPESSHLMLKIADPDRRSARLEEMINWLAIYL